MEAATILGYLGGGIVCLQGVPQLIKVWRNQSAENISFLSLITYLVGASLIVVYGILIGQPPIYATIAVSIMNAILLLTTKVYFDLIEKRTRSTKVLCENSC